MSQGGKVAETVRSTLSSFFENPVDRVDVSQELLNIARRDRTNPLPWKGQFSPQLVDALLARYATPETRVLDPFMGSGTVLLEAGRANLAAVGSEINPAGLMLSRVYTLINMPTTARRELLRSLRPQVENAILEPPPLFREVQQHFRRGLPQLLRLRDELDDRLGRIALDAVVTLADLGGNAKAKPDESLLQQWHRILNLILNLPFSRLPIEALRADARDLPLPGSSVDLIITSPPYINVFNYHQAYRRSVEVLGWDVLSVAHSEIGSNRKHRGNRFLTVTQYVLDMALALVEMLRVCSVGARLILIVGRESTVRGTPFFNGAIVAEVAQRALGLPLCMRQERVFQNRFGRQIFEDILHYEAPATPTDVDLEEARAVASDVLEAARRRAPESEVEGIEDAVSRIGETAASKLLCVEDERPSLETV